MVYSEAWERIKTDKFKCKICGGRYTRANKAQHQGRQKHKFMVLFKKKMNKILEKKLTN